MYKGYLDTCMPSELMREYLRTAKLTHWHTVNLIMDAPVSIYTKREELEKVKADAEARHDAELIHWSNVGLKNIEQALGYLEADGIFSIEIGEYNQGSILGRYSFDQICADFGDVMEYIRENLEDCKIGPEDLYWYSIDKWIKNDKGKYEPVCSYIIVRDEIIYVSIYKREPELEVYYNEYDSENLNVPVPFKPGDILEFDGFPFGPKSHVLITEIGDNWDCCSVQGFALNDGGEWDIGAVKHGMVGLDYSPKISYLYSAKPYDGPLEPEEQLMLRMRAYIDGDEKKAKLFDDQFFHSTEEIVAWLDAQERERKDT